MALIVYGSYGYTGQLIVEECRLKNLEVVLSGRNAEALRKQSLETGFPFHAVDVSDSSALKDLLRKGKVVIHCAGPFQYTAQAMANACLATKTHYTDITGEYQVFEWLAGHDQNAKDAGIMIMPGTGFDVVPSDCLSVHLKNRLPSATHLQLAFTMSKGGLSRGTSKTMIEGLGNGSLIRKDGVLKKINLGEKILDVDFGPFTAKTLNIPWGDISTAWRSTKIPNIEVYTGATEKMISNAKRSRYFNWLLRQRWLKNYLQKKVDQKPAGPSEENRKQSRSYLWGKVWDEKGNACISRLETLSGYMLTAKTAVLIAEKIINNQYQAGYQTPGMAYGADLILELSGTVRTDENN
jgi:short subunit dehydrogenase-like uncharacterized protein